MVQNHLFLAYHYPVRTVLSSTQMFVQLNSLKTVCIVFYCNFQPNCEILNCAHNFFFLLTVDLLGLLKWSSRPEALKDSLLALMKVEGEEVVKFLQDVLDALFDILMQNSDSDLYDNMVFECLVS